MEMHNPPHPGEVLRELYLEPLGLTVGGAAKALGVSRTMLSRILNGHAGITSAIACGSTPRLSAVFHAFFTP